MEGGELLSIAVPLVSVVDEQALLSRVLAPILAAEYALASMATPSIPTVALDPNA